MSEFFKKKITEPGGHGCCSDVENITLDKVIRKQVMKMAGADLSEVLAITASSNVVAVSVDNSFVLLAERFKKGNQRGKKRTFIFFSN